VVRPFSLSFVSYFLFFSMCVFRVCCFSLLVGFNLVYLRLFDLMFVSFILVYFFIGSFVIYMWLYFFSSFARAFFLEAFVR